MMQLANRIGLLILLLLVPVRSAQAIGTEFTLSGSDLIVDVDAKWAGCTQGGYYPLRVSVRNNGKPRTITLEVRQNNDYQKCPRVRRTVSLEQNASINTSLLVPMVSNGSYVEFRVLERGRLIRNFSESVSLPESVGSSDVGSGMLIVAKKAEDGQNYNTAVNQLFLGTSSRRYGSYENAQHVRPQNLPVNWLAYTGLDILAIPLESLTDEISSDARKAILEWVVAGGNLLVYEIGEPVAHSDRLDEALAIKERAFVKDGWEKLIVKRFKRQTIVDPVDPSVREVENFSEGKPWLLKPERFGMRSLGLGKVIALSDNPFPGTASHWIWLLNHLGNNRLLWHQRNGIFSRGSNESFFQFLIPNVGGVPVLSLLVLITLFTVVIGPVNYLYFLKKRQLAMLLVTVPAIAFGSSLLLLAYSTISHGFSVKSRVRSITFVDQKQNHATSITRVAYYAGMAPSAGLQFEPTTAVYPIWPTDNAFESAQLDWSEKQHMKNGWLRSRTRTQFLTVSQQEQRGRIELQSITTDAPKVSNGLEWNIQTLYVVDPSGKKWIAKDLDAGGIGNLEPVTDKHYQEIQKYISRYAMTLPEGTTANVISSGTYASTTRYAYGHYNTLTSDYRKSLQEQKLTTFTVNNAKKLDSMKPGSYFAILNQAPSLDLGLKNANENIPIHLLFGYF